MEWKLNICHPFSRNLYKSEDNKSTQALKKTTSFGINSFAYLRIHVMNIGIVPYDIQAFLNNFKMN